MQDENFNGPFCQSCCMPLDKPEVFGTNADGGRNDLYCHYCFQNGDFTTPDITMEEMLEKCVGIMEQMGLPQEIIEGTKAYFPQLQRWKK